MDIDVALRQHFGPDSAAASMATRLPGERSTEVVLPPEDDADAEGPQPVISFPVAGDTFEITYCDSRDNLSVRRISVRRIDRHDDHVILKAFCFEREALRSFRLDRVQSAVDVVTGEVFGDHDDLLSEIRWETDRQALSGFGDILHDVRLLTYMAQCDGRFSVSEIEVIQHYIEGMGHREERESVARRLQRLVPDRQAFEDSLAEISGWPDDRLQHFGEAAVELVLADGRIDEAETAALNAIRYCLEERGINLSVRHF